MAFLAPGYGCFPAFAKDTEMMSPTSVLGWSSLQPSSLGNEVAWWCNFCLALTDPRFSSNLFWRAFPKQRVILLLLILDRQNISFYTTATSTKRVLPKSQHSMRRQKCYSGEVYGLFMNIKREAKPMDLVVSVCSALPGFQRHVTVGHPLEYLGFTKLRGQSYEANSRRIKN